MRALAEYLLKRFLGKFVSKIDEMVEGSKFNKETLTLQDLNLNCRVSLISFLIIKSFSSA